MKGRVLDSSASYVVTLQASGKSFSVQPDETILDGFDKYILLFRPQKGGKVNINEKQPNVIFQEKLIPDEAN